MAVTKHIAEYDIVALTEPIDNAPAGAQGGVLDIFRGDMAMVEITTMPGKMDIDRIIAVPLSKLRVVDPAPNRS